MIGVKAGLTIPSPSVAGSTVFVNKLGTELENDCGVGVGSTHEMKLVEESVSMISDRM